MQFPWRQCVFCHTGWIYVIFGTLTALIKALHAFNMLPKDHNDNIQFEYEKICSSLQQFSIINQIISCCTMLCLKECHGYYNRRIESDSIDRFLLLLFRCVVWFSFCPSSSDSVWAGGVDAECFCWCLPGLPGLGWVKCESTEGLAGETSAVPVWRPELWPGDEEGAPF